MTKDYLTEAQQRQEQEARAYQQQRNPFEYGQQVARRRYSEIMSGIDAQKASAQQSYGDMYQAARQRAVGQQAAGGPTLSGGMGQQQRDFVSAMEMQQLGQIGQAREGAMRDLYTQGQSAWSNAQLEGQQAQQMELQNQQTNLQLVQQQQAIIQDTNLTEDQKREQLGALGVNYDEVSQNLNNENRGILGWKGVFDGEATGGDIANAVFRTALAAGAIYFFGPAALKLAGRIGTKFIAGSDGKVLLGTQGWKSLMGGLKTPGILGPYTPFKAGASGGLLNPILNYTPMS